jgi:hypothetical protein
MCDPRVVGDPSDESLLVLLSEDTLLTDMERPCTIGIEAARGLPTFLSSSGFIL